MNINWFKNSNNVVYADVNQFAENFSKETGVTNLKQKLDDFKINPSKEGITLIGKKRTSLKVFIPDLLFDEHIEMGENVWIYMGENYEAYCVYWPIETKNYSFFSNVSCEFFPCHETKDGEEFNCLFCYCPLYALGEKCGGNYVYLADGTKDCSNCKVPHQRESYDYVMSKFSKLKKLAERIR